MARLEQISRPVFKAPTKGRCYLTLNAAADAEARAQLDAKYPVEHAEYDNGQMYYSGWHWSADETLVKVHKRLATRLRRAFRKADQANVSGSEMEGGKG